MKTGLVLAGGGTRGAYQSGAVKALRELGKDWQVVTGTSIGSLNGCMLAQGDEASMHQLWDEIVMEDILADELPKDFDLNTLISSRNLLTSFFKKYIKEQGADITPFEKSVDKYFNNDRLQKSKIDFGCVTVLFPSLKPVFVTKEMMNEKGADYLIASASCFPAFPKHEIDGKSYIDGGYYDNVPIEYCLELGAKHCIVLDLNDVPQHPQYMNRECIDYIFPRFSTESFLNFDRAVLNRNIQFGYNDVMKFYGRYSGVKYTLHKIKTPSFFHQYYLDILSLEQRIKRATVMHEPSLVTSKLLKQQFKVILSIEDLGYGIMDNILDLFPDLSHEKVYNFEEIIDIVYDGFKEALDDDYTLIPDLNVKDILAYTKTLDTKGIVTKLVYQLLHEDHRVFSENAVLTVYPFEASMAHWIIKALKAKKTKK